MHSLCSISDKGNGSQRDALGKREKLNVFDVATYFVMSHESRSL
jgi:hypothetical protein